MVGGMQPMCLQRVINMPPLGAAKQNCVLSNPNGELCNTKLPMDIVDTQQVTN